jgi:glycosyltransferase involved in cell wall biosynthesis
MNKPLVSIVIPTWQRERLLLETLNHIIIEQTYSRLEVIVVFDGQQTIPLDLAETFGVKVVQLGCNYSRYRPQSFGIAPLSVGYLMATGRYVMPWCDDERALVDTHIEQLVDLMEITGVDFVYPKVKIWRVDDPDGPETTVIGVKPPIKDQITHYMFVRENLWLYGMPDWDSHPMDWSLVDKWMKQGATYEMLDQCTFSHRLDQ